MKKLALLLALISFNCFSASSALDDVNNIISQKEDVIKQAKENDKFGIVFIFESNCPYCHKFAPELKNFANKNHIKIIDFSMNSLGIPSFESPLPMNDILTKRFYGNGQIGYPATYLVKLNRPTTLFIPLTVGYLSEDQFASIWHQRTTNPTVVRYFNEN